MSLKVCLKDPNAQAPCRKTPGSAGHDLCCVDTVILTPRSSALVATGVCIGLPPNTYGQIAPRSGLSVKGLDIGAGIIDEDYRGEIKVLLRNTSESEVVLQQGDRIAQLLVLPIVYPTVEMVETLDDTERGEGGFGSTGK
jgi:dUTP pyrophosphatase